MVTFAAQYLNQEIHHKIFNLNYEYSGSDFFLAKKNIPSFFYRSFQTFVW